MKQFRVFISLFIFCQLPLVSVGQSKRADSLFAEIKKHSDTSNIFRYSLLTEELRRQSPAKAVWIGFIGIREAERLGFYKGKCTLLINVASIYNQWGKQDSAEYYMNQALVLARKKSIVTSEIYALTGLSDLLRIIGRYDDALVQLQALYKLSVQLANGDLIAHSLGGQAYISWRKNNPGKALELFKRAAVIADSVKSRKESVSALTGIALIYDDMKQYDKAIELYHKMERVLEGTSDYSGMATVFFNIAGIYIDNQQLDSGLRYINKVIAIAEANKLTKMLAGAYGNLSLVYSQKNELEKSELSLKRSLVLSREAEDKLSEAFVLNKLCEVYMKQKHFDKIEPYLNDAIRINREMGDSAQLKECYSMASRLYEHKKDFRKAFDYRLKYDAINDTMYNAENNRVINEMLAKYESDAKQRENTLLQKENNMSASIIRQQKNQTYFIIGGAFLALLLIIFIALAYKLQRDNYELKVKQQEVQLVKLNEMKTVADLKTLQARINPHFLYNSLNSIAALIHDEPDQAEEMTIKLSHLFRYSINTQEANWSAVKDELTIVSTYLDIERVRFGNRIDFKIIADESLMNEMIPRFLLQPLVENALKHGLKDINAGGHLIVTLSDKKDLIEINVHDNGNPFPQNINVGYGLQSIKDKLNLLCGTTWKMSFINDEDKRICIELPKIIRP